MYVHMYVRNLVLTTSTECTSSFLSYKNVFSLPPPSYSLHTILLPILTIQYSTHTHTIIHISHYTHTTIKHIPYSGEFSRVLIFAIFADQCKTAKFVTLKILLTTFTAQNAIVHSESVRVILENVNTKNIETPHPRQLLPSKISRSMVPSPGLTTACTWSIIPSPLTSAWVE